MTDLKSQRPTAEPSHAPRNLEEVVKKIALLSMLAQSDPYSSAEVYRKALIHICNYSLSELDRVCAASQVPRAASEASDASKNEIVICAAVKMGRLIIRGHRHDDCLRNLHARQLDPAMLIEQGFVTSRNRFVSREDAMRLQKTAGAKSCYSQDGELHGDILFSEDLY